MWSLVEFLAFQRVRVSYSYFPRYFTVTFLNIGAETAQQLLDDWAHSEKAPPVEPDVDQRVFSRA